TYILAEACPEEGLGSAVMNRLLKAAGHRVIEAGGDS
ncbi:MAG: Sua5 family C-terminal domain-containing protein, partial [Paenibacillus sp.]